MGRPKPPDPMETARQQQNFNREGSAPTPRSLASPTK